MKASVRAAGIKDLSKKRGGLGASEEHGKRLDETSQARIITERNSLSWSKAGQGRELDLVEAFKIHKKETGAKERNNCEIGTHLLVTISPECLSESDDVHEPKNEQILKLIEESKKWVESWQGAGAVFAWRFDLDEKGSGVVDLFTAPVREQGRRGGKKVLTIAPSQAKRELTRSTGEKTSGAAFQTSWADWAQQRLDQRFQRGLRKKETGREHVHAEVYAAAAEKAAKLLQDAQKQKNDLDTREKELCEQAANLEAREAKIEQARDIVKKELEQVKEAIDEDQLIQVARDQQQHFAELAKKKLYEAESKFYELERREKSFEKRSDKLRKKAQDSERLQIENKNLKEKNKNLEDDLNETKNLLHEIKFQFERWTEKFKLLFHLQFEIVKKEIELEEEAVSNVNDASPS